MIRISHAEQDLCNQIIPLAHREWIKQQDEAGAKAIVGQLPPVNGKRYRFQPIQQLTQRDKAIQALFERSFQGNHQQVVLTAQRVACREFYPLWKRVVLIKAPQEIHDKITHIITKVLLVLVASIITIGLGFRAYQAIGPLFASRALPLIINHTPLALIRLFNQTMDAKEWVLKNTFKFLGSVWLTKAIILSGPKIPYLTNAAKAISISSLFWMIYGAPQSAFWFILGQGSSLVVNPTLTICDTIGGYCKSIAIKAKFEKEKIEKEAARQVWMQVANKLRPA